MTLAARHLQTRRPRKDRAVTWSRRCCDGSITWTFWRRDHRHALHCLSRTFDVAEHPPLNYMVRALRHFHRHLRDLVDEIDLAAMEEIA